MMRLTKPAALTVSLLFSLIPFSSSALAADEAPKPQYAIAMHGKPKYGPDFKHFDYVNPDAPKGGTLKMAAVGNSYDSFNPYILKGVPVAGIDHIYDTLMVSSGDEPFTEYGLVADSITVAKDRSWVEFHINPKARFQDGKPITAADVVFSFNILITKGQPGYEAYYHDVKDVKAINSHLVRFDLKNTHNRELPLILGQVPVLPKHYWEHHKFDSTALNIPVGSGPYRIEKFDAGSSITYVRDKNYWAKDLPVNRGRYNFNRIVYEYFNDDTVALQAFKAGDLNLRLENIAKNWATMYSGPKFASGEITKEEIPQHLPVGMQAFVYNTRRPVFSDRQVRRAIAYAFDFNWTNKALFYGQYERNDSYFENSDLANQGLPKGKELALLEPFRKDLPPEVFTEHYEPPATSDKVTLRDNLKTAYQILQKDGWSIKNGAMINNKTGMPLTFEILLRSKSMERVVLPFTQNLQRLGIKVNIRLVDSSQYIERMNHFDFDMAILVLPESDSPGNEQRDKWTSLAAKTPGSSNYMGVSSPVVDKLVGDVIQADSREDLVAATRALDRVLLWGYYTIPQWFLPVNRVAYYRPIQHPSHFPKSGVDIDSWWSAAAH